MDRLVILAPALLGITFLLVMFATYGVLCLTGRAPEVLGGKSSRTLGPYLTNFLLWLIRPVETLFVVNGISPNAVTLLSLLLCVGAGAAIGSGYLATGAWLYASAGVTDILDGRIARATGRQSKAGALVDSVSDRWGELAIFAGCAWYLHASGWLMALMLAVAGSMMVSYTRARGEGLGLSLEGGMMQRAERVIVVAIGAMIGAWFAATPAQAGYAAGALGIALGVCGTLASITAVGRLIDGYRTLTAREQPPAIIEAKVRTEARNPMRISGEHIA